MRRLLLAALLGPACLLGACQTNTYCDAPNTCHASGTRDGSGTCVAAPLPEGTKCDDHSACTTNDKCTRGVCGGAAVTCTNKPCQVATACDPHEGCPAPQNLPEGSACDDKSVCTHDDHCVEGECQGTLVVHCTGPATDACHLPEACDPNSGSCVSAAMGGPCAPNLMASPTVGCPYNDYGAVVNVGNANLNLLLDSGSTTLAVANANCTSCTGITPRYIPGSSATALGTSVSSVYLDQTSWQGKAYLDQVTPLGTQGTVRMKLASISSQNRFFRPWGCVLGSDQPCSYEGIIGLGPAGNAVTGTDSYTDKAAHVLPFNAFSMLMCPSNGLFWWGGYDPVTVVGAPHFTPFTASDYYYQVDLTDVSVGPQSIAAGLTDVVVDTGTSVMFLPRAAVTALADQVATNPTFINNFGDAQDPHGSAQDFFLQVQCVKAAAGATPAELNAALPPFTMTFPNAQGGFTVELQATDSYLQPLPIDPSQNGGQGYCSGVAPNSVSGGRAILILGGAGMINNIFIFDRVNNQLGIAATNACAEM